MDPPEGAQPNPPEQPTPPTPPTQTEIDVVQIATQAAAQAAAQVASAQANPPTEQPTQPDPPAEPSETLTPEQIEEQVNQRAAERIATVDMTRALIDDSNFDFGKASNEEMLKAALGDQYVDGMDVAEMRGFVRALAAARAEVDNEGNTPPSPTRGGDGRFQQTPQFYGLDPAHPDFKQRSEALQFHIQEMSKSPQQHRFERRARAAGQVLERQTA